MDNLIIDEYEIETETDNLYSEEIIDTGIEILNIEAADSVEDLVYDLIFQTETIELGKVPETEVLIPETEMLIPETEVIIPETELISAEPETVTETEVIIPETELISAEPETVPETEVLIPETELISAEPETVPETEVLIPETELISAEPETVSETEVLIPETELISAEPETVPETEVLIPETELISAEPETVPETEVLIPETELIIVENIASEHLDSLGVLNETHEDVQMDKVVSDQQIVQEEILSDNKVIENKDPEDESEFSFVELVKSNSKDENLKDDSDINNTLYDIDDIYNIISLRIPENSRLFTSKHNLDDIYDLLSDSLPIDLLPAEYVRSVDKEDKLDVVEIVEESNRSSFEVAESESESETTSIDDIYDLIDQQNKILLSNQEIEIAILQNQKTISDNDNKMNTFLVSGVFAVLGAVVISNLFRGIK